jgi:hypothetical protein
MPLRNPLELFDTAILVQNSWLLHRSKTRRRSAQAKLEYRRRHLVVDCLNTKLPKSLNVARHLDDVLCSALPEKMDKLGRLPTEGRKCVKAQLPKVAPAGAVGLIFRRGLMRSGSISPTHFRLQFRAPPCFLHHAFRILRKCRKTPERHPYGNNRAYGHSR